MLSLLINHMASFARAEVKSKIKSWHVGLCRDLTDLYPYQVM